MGNRPNADVGFGYVIQDNGEECTFTVDGKETDWYDMANLLEEGEGPVGALAKQHGIMLRTAYGDYAPTFVCLEETHVNCDWDGAGTVPKGIFCDNEETISALGRICELLGYPQTTAPSVFLVASYG
ncbi:MAG: hypothetical protein L3J47_00080 [Sulfurovum sp.]|nr:hypothetical protein [Sulfurovum sp.]